MKRVDWFLAGMVLAVLLAFAFPEPGARGGALHAEVANKLAVALIFFLHGVTLPFQALKAGTLRFRLHLVVQLSTFLLFPLLGLALYFATRGFVGPSLSLGLFYLCALPSTVSSSVALTAVARGNVAGAVFNATLSSLLGVFLTPAWLALLLGSLGQALPLGAVIADLASWLLLPLALGQLVRPLLGAPLERYRRYLAPVDRVTILFLVYTSFCDSVKLGIWSRQGVLAPVFTLGVAVALLGTVMLAVSVLARVARLGPEDRIPALFCGSKKTLASGVPMATLLFGAHPNLGLILLPILIYHPLQLFVGGALAARFARKAEARDAARIALSEDGR